MLDIDGLRAWLNGVNDAFEAAYDATEEMQTLRSLAKWLCERGGHVTDLICMGSQGQIPMRAAKGTVAIVLPVQPQWVLFVDDARAIMEAQSFLDDMSKKAAA